MNDARVGNKLKKKKSSLKNLIKCSRKDVNNVRKRGHNLLFYAHEQIYTRVKIKKNKF